MSKMLLQVDDPTFRFVAVAVKEVARRRLGAGIRQVDICATKDVCPILKWRDIASGSWPTVVEVESCRRPPSARGRVAGLEKRVSVQLRLTFCRQRAAVGPSSFCSWRVPVGCFAKWLMQCSVSNILTNRNELTTSTMIDTFRFR